MCVCDVKGLVPLLLLWFLPGRVLECCGAQSSDLINYCKIVEERVQERRAVTSEALRARGCPGRFPPGNVGSRWARRGSVALGRVPACLSPQTSQADITNVSLSFLCDSIPQLCAEGRGWRWWGDPAGSPRPAPQRGCPGPCRCSPLPTAEKSRGRYPTRGRGTATNEVPRPLPCTLAGKGSAAGVSGDDPGKPAPLPEA